MGRWRKEGRGEEEELERIEEENGREERKEDKKNQKHREYNLAFFFAGGEGCFEAPHFFSHQKEEKEEEKDEE